jgi:GNAT superfamily N-acetyltransferase
MNIDIYTDTEKTAEFYALMGYYFAHRKIRREMPYLVDDDGYTWFVAIDDGQVTGFASCHVDKANVGHLHGIYVEQEQRRKGIATALVEKRLEWLRARGVGEFVATASPKSRSVLDRLGFVEINKKGQYTKMILKDGDHGSV